MPNCAYCHTPLASARDRCPSCGAHGGQPGPGRNAVPPPDPQPQPPMPETAPPGFGTRLGAGLLWALGGGLGLHCFFSGHTRRGLVYLALIAGIVATVSMVPPAELDGSSPPGAAVPSVTAFGLMIALAALWLYDGVRILVGRFP